MCFYQVYPRGIYLKYNFTDRNNLVDQPIQHKRIKSQSAMIRRLWFTSASGNVHLITVIFSVEIGLSGLPHRVRETNSNFNAMDYSSNSKQEVSRIILINLKRESYRNLGFSDQQKSQILDEESNYYNTKFLELAATSSSIQLDSFLF